MTSSRLTAIGALALLLALSACAQVEQPVASAEDNYEIPAELLAMAADTGVATTTTTSPPAMSAAPAPTVEAPPSRTALEALASAGRPLPLPNSRLLPDVERLEPSVVTAGGERHLLRNVSVSVTYSDEDGLIVDPAGWWVINYPLDRVVGAQGNSLDELSRSLLGRRAADLTNYYFYTEPEGRQTPPEPEPASGPAPITVTQGPDFVVNNQHPDASDENSGSLRNPLLTISAAVDRAEPGTTIHVYPGVYREAVVVDTDGTEEQPIRIEGIRGATGSMPVITGNDAFPAGAWTEVEGRNGVYQADAFTDLAGSVALDGEELVERAAAWQLKSGEYVVTTGAEQFVTPRFDGDVRAREGSLQTFGSSQYIWEAKQTDGGGFVDLGSEFGDDFEGGVYWGSAWVYIDRPTSAEDHQWYQPHDFDLQVSGPFRAGGVSGVPLSEQPYEYRVWLDGVLLDGNVAASVGNGESALAHPEIGRGEFGETWANVVMREGWHHLVFQWDTTSDPDVDRPSPIFRFGIPDVADKAVTSASEPSSKRRATQGTPQTFVSEYMVLGPVPSEYEPTVYLRLPGDEDPNEAALDMAARSGPVVSIFGDFVELHGFEVRHGSQVQGESLVAIGRVGEEPQDDVYVQGVVVEGNRIVGSEFGGIAASVSGDQGFAPISIRNNWVVDSGAVGISAQGISDRLTAETLDDWAPGRAPVDVSFNTVVGTGWAGYSLTEHVSGVLFERMTGSSIRYNSIEGVGPGITLRGENYGIRVDGNRVIDPYGWGIGVEGNPGPNLIANNVVTGLIPGPEWKKAHLLTWDSDQTWIINNTTDGEWNTDSGWYGDVGSWGAGGPDNFDRLEFSNWELSVFRRIYMNNVFVGSYLGGVEDYLGDWGESDTFWGNYREVPRPNPYDYHDDGAERFSPSYAFEDRSAGDYRLNPNSDLNSSGVVNKTAELAALDFYGLPRSHEEDVEAGAFRANPSVSSGDTLIEVYLIDGTVFRIED